MLFTLLWLTSNKLILGVISIYGNVDFQHKETIKKKFCFRSFFFWLIKAILNFLRADKQAERVWK